MVGELAQRDFFGVEECDVFVILSEPTEGRSMYVELGVALALRSLTGRPSIYAIGPRNTHSIFHYAPEVQSVAGIDDLLDAVREQPNDNSAPVLANELASQEVRLEEYRALRAEMLDIMKDRIWGQATYAVIVAGILAFAFSSSSAHKVPGFVFLIALALPFLGHTIWREHARIRMGNYLRAVVEPGLRGLGWERFLAIWRSEYGAKEGQGWLTFRQRSTHIFALSGLFLITSVFALVLLVQTTSRPLPLCLGALLMAALAGMYVYFFLLYNIGTADYAKLQALNFKL
jgi:hypothetical protein